MLGYLEGIDSDRGIARRCVDSISLRGFWSTVFVRIGRITRSRTPRRLSLEVHEEVFT